MVVAAEGRALRRRWAGWGGALLAVGLVAVLTCLAAANVVVRGNWREVEDGVLWAERPEGVVAAEVAPGSPADEGGVQPGDVLLAVDGASVESVNDVLARLHGGRDGSRLKLSVLHLGTRQLREAVLEPVPTNDFTVYRVLAGVGLFALLVGMWVRVRRPRDQATLHFFWLTVAFFGMFAFSFTGRLDRLDWVFFWADAVSTVLLAPLFVHFALVFPDRSPGWVRTSVGRSVFPLIYLPALALGVTQTVVLSGPGTSDTFTRILEGVWRLEILYLAACVVAGLVLMIVSLRRAPSVTSRRQLRWIVWGAVLGGLPFTIGYAVPFALGIEPPGRLYLTAIPLGLIPLAFASAIVRYRLRDVEVIVKRGLVYTAAVAAMVAIYLILEQLASEVFLEQSDEHNSIIALLATAVVVLLASPVKNSIQNMLDRAHYRDRYDYRRALVGFARDLNSDLDLGRLSERLVARVTETLVVDRMVLLLADRRDEADGDFWPIRATGFDVMPPPLGRSSALVARLAARHMVALDDPAMTRRVPPEEVEAWLERGIWYFIPCVSEEGTIAVMAVGRKGSGEPLSSEDMALLTAVAGQVATALENGRLYSQLRQKAGELDRMREFAENIIESLNDGLVVLDLDDRVVRWNAGLDRLYGVARMDAIGQPLDALFDAPFVDRLRQARANVPAGAALYRVPLLSRHREDRRRLLVNAATVPLRAADGATTGYNGDDGRHHGPRAARGTVADFREDGVDRAARRRRGARGQHTADRHFELHSAAARRRRSGRSPDEAP